MSSISPEVGLSTGNPSSVRLDSLPTVIIPQSKFPEPLNIPHEAQVQVLGEVIGEDSPWPRQGEEGLLNEPPKILVPLSREALETQVLGAIHASLQHLPPDSNLRDHVLVVASKEPRRYIENHLSYSGVVPVVPSEWLEDVLHWEELRNHYGVEGPFQDNLGGLSVQALIVERMIQTPLRGRRCGWDLLCSKYPKMQRKHLLRLADALAQNPNAIYAFGVTPDDWFPDFAELVEGIEGGEAWQMYQQAVVQGAWPTHRIMTRRGVLDRMPWGNDEHTSDLFMSMAAAEISASLGVPLVKVYNEFGLQDPYLEPPMEEKMNVYANAAEVIAGVLSTREEYLTTASADAYRDINDALGGIVIPPLLTLLREKYVDLDELAEIRARLVAEDWPAVPDELMVVLPPNMSHPDFPSQQEMVKAVWRALSHPRMANPHGSDDFVAGVVNRIPSAIRRPADRSRTTHLIEDAKRRPPAILSLLYALRSSYLFNVVRDEHDRPVTNFFPRELKHFLKQGCKYAEEADVVVLVPFHREPETARAIVEQLGEIVPHVVTGGNDRDTLDTFKGWKGKGGFVVVQDEILEFVRSEVFERYSLAKPGERQSIEVRDSNTGVLLRRESKRTKGNTDRALILAAIAAGWLHPYTFVIKNDSDYTNASGENAYRAAEHLLGAMANMPPNVTFIDVVLALLGPERRNQPPQAVANIGQNFGTPEQQLASLLLNNSLWHLAGERCVLGKMLVDMPFPDGYTEEVWMNLMASLEALNPGIVRGQVATTRKKEQPDSSPPKDYAMTQFVALGLLNYLKVWEDMILERLYDLPMNQRIGLQNNPIAFLQWERNLRGVRPTDWDPETVAYVNRRLAGVPLLVTVFDEADASTGKDPKSHNLPNQDWLIPMDAFWPSIRSLVVQWKGGDVGPIDWKGIVGYLRDRGAPLDENELQNACWRQWERERQIMRERE